MRPFIFISFLLMMIGLSSCNPRGGASSTLSRATGAAYEVIVVMDKAAWDSNAGTALREELTAPVPYLLQAESSMKYTYVKPELFGSLFQYVRNILIVDVNKSIYTKVSLLNESDKWVKGQTILYLNAPDIESLESYLTGNERIIVNYFTKVEMKRTADMLRENYSSTVMNMVKEKFGIALYVPTEITSKSQKISDDFLWFSNDAPTGRMDIMVYTFPYIDKNTFTLDYLVAKRDSFTKIMIPGSFENTYMSTEKRVVDYYPSTLNGKYCGILRGWWRMEGGDMMGGPFVSYARVDEPNRRVIVTEGFVYEPQKEKKNYLRRLEAALQTTRFPDEL